MDKIKAAYKKADEILAKSNIETGDKDLLGPDAFKNGKFRLNMMIDLDVVDEIRKLAAEERIPYQTWINRELGKLVHARQHASNESMSSIFERLEKLEISMNKKPPRAQKVPRGT